MKNNLLLLSSLVLAAATCATPLVRADDAPATPSPATTQSVDLSTPTKTVQSFAAAVDSNALAQAQQCVVDDPAQQSVIAQMISTKLILIKFSDAAKAKFPVDSAPDLADMPNLNLSPSIVGGLQEEISPDGTTATVSKSDQNNSNYHTQSLKKVGNDWKLDFAASPNGAKQMAQAPEMAQFVKKFDDAANDLLADKFKTWTEVQAALTPPPQSQPAADSTNK